MSNKRFSNDHLSLPIWVLAICVFLQLVAYLLRFPLKLSSQISDWSAFSTYLGLSFSFLSVFLVYLTYRSQSKMSAVLQFESVFFQWHDQHRAIYNNIAEYIKEFSDKVVLPFIRGHKGEFSIDDFVQHAHDSNQREVMRYYRSLYHLMKYVHLSPILGNDEDKRRMYVDIIQAQMTDEELNTVLYLLLADEWKDSTEVLGCSWKQVVDDYHLLKNYYYEKSEQNFKEFVEFMNSEFKETKDSFHFLRLDATE